MYVYFPNIANIHFLLKRCLLLFQSLSGGTVNRTLRVVHNGDYKDGFIVRINGTVGENVRRHVQWRIQDFPEEVVTSKRGRQPTNWPFFPENCMKMKKFWPGRGGRIPCAPWWVGASGVVMYIFERSKNEPMISYWIFVNFLTKNQ